MEAQTSISMNRVSHLTRDAYRRDKDRNLVFHSQRDVLGQPRVRFVDGKLRSPRRVSGRQPVPYVFQPILIASGGSLIESRKGPEDAGPTGFNHHNGTCDQEHWRHDGRPGETPIQGGGNHCFLPSIDQASKSKVEKKSSGEGMRVYV